MINLDEIIGDVIFVSFRRADCFHEIGISETSGHYRLKGYDQLGLWLEHPGIIIHRSEDEEGKLLPIEEHSEEFIEAQFVATWDNINTLMHYPEREGYDFPSEFEKKIGFKFPKDEENIKE